MGIVINKEDRVLVVSPHPDDESIGCGGFLSLYRGQCDVLLATDGYNEELNNKEQSEMRVKEFHNATDFLNVNNKFLLHIPERKIKNHYNAFLKIDFSKYKYILVPNRFEEHFDHKQLYYVINKIVKQRKIDADILEYEVWTTIRHPNVKVDISTVIDDKKHAIQMHESQIKDLDYVGMITGLNAYRGKGHDCDFAEVFYSEKQAKLKRKKELKKRIKSRLNKSR